MFCVDLFINEFGLWGLYHINKYKMENNNNK